MTTPLLDRVARDAAAEADRCIADAREEATQIAAAATAARLAREQSAIAQKRAALAAAQELACSQARWRTARITLEARARFLERVTKEAEQVAMDPPPGLFTASDVAALMLVALRYVDESARRIRCGPAARPLVERALAALNANAEVIEDASVPAGAMIESRDGRVRVSATLVGAVRRLRESIAIAAVGMVNSQERAP